MYFAPGLVWDKENTIYAADHKNNTIFSIPSGSMTPQTPLKILHVESPYGIALINTHDNGLDVFHEAAPTANWWSWFA